MTSSWSSWLRNAIFATVLAAATFAAPSASAEIELVAPKLQVPVPGLDLTPPSLEDGYVTVGYVAEYVAGVYVFLLGIVGIVAAVMIMWGGFLYLTAGGAADRVGKGRKRIIDALIGLVLAFGSYTILWAINPDLVEFRALRLERVKTEDASLGYTTADTGWFSDPERVAVTQATSPNGPSTGGDGTGGKTEAGADNTSVAPYKYEWTACPFELTGTIKEKDTVAGHMDFFNKVRQSGLIKGTPAQKVLRAANLANVCKAVLGSCGSTAGDINALAGVGKTDCLNEDVYLQKEIAKYKIDQITDPKKKAKALANAESRVQRDKGNCNDVAHGKQIFTIPSEVNLLRYAIRCETEGYEGWDKCKFSGPWTSSDSDCIRTDCVPATAGFEGKSKSDKEAGKLARLKFVADIIKASENIPALKGYPDSIANQLLPGDRLNIYNGNDDLTGGHAIIFLGWAKDKITAQTVDGSSGTETHYSSWWCLRSDCIKKGKNFYPITKVWRP